MTRTQRHRLRLGSLSLAVVLTAAAAGCMAPGKTQQSLPDTGLADGQLERQRQVGLAPPAYQEEGDVFSRFGLEAIPDDRRKVLNSYGAITGPITGLTPAQVAAFHRGGDLFGAYFAEEDGAGPIMNEQNCATCHQVGGVGGSGHEDVERMAMIDTTDPNWMVNSTGFYPMIELGGPLLQKRGGEVIPSQASVDALADALAAQGLNVGRQVVLSARITTMVAGNGLLTTVPDAQILQRASMPKPFGIGGKANVLSGRLGELDLTGRVGKLGLKAQLPDNEAFFADAAQQELGLSNPANPFEPSLNGPHTLVAQTDVNQAQTDDFLAFCAGLAPPKPVEDDYAGRRAFYKAGCAVCHFSGYFTEGDPAKLPSSLRDFGTALGGKPVPAYTDLLVHRMAKNKGDGFRQGSAEGAEWRTAPLWGLRFKTAFMHDGEGESLEQAITMHMGEGSEANQVIENYLGVSTVNPANNLSETERKALLQFLKKL